MPELTELRTYNSNTIDNGDGTFTLNAHVGHIHYKDSSGDMQPVDFTWVDKGTYWQMKKASYNIFVSKDFAAADLIRFDNKFDGANHTIYYKPHSIWWMNADNKTQRTKWKDAQSVTGTVSGDTITWENCFGAGVNFEVTLKRSGFVKNVVLPSKPPTGGAPYANWYLVPVFQYTGDGITVKSDENTDWNGTDYYEWDGEFELRETVSGLKTFIKQAYGIDSSDPPKFKKLPVFFEKKGGSLWQGKLISENLIENATYPARFDTTSTYYSGSGDGYVRNEAADTWANVRGAATGTESTDSTSPAFAQSYESGGTIGIGRTFQPSDTSAIPDAATITAASFFAYFYSSGTNTDNDGYDYYALVETTQASTSSLTTADYDAVGSTKWSNSDHDITDLTSNTQYYEWVFNATGLAGISKTGWTKIGFREGHDFDNHEIATGTNNRARYYTSERTGTANDPYLSVTYTTAGDFMTTNTGYWGALP